MGGAGKGDLPREGQYSKKMQEAFSRGYERIYGKGCNKRRGKKNPCNLRKGTKNDDDNV